MNYIVSYPRSGNTAARYIIELLTKMPSNGVCGDVNDRDRLQKPLTVADYPYEDYVIHKRHDFKGITKDDFVLFILRDPLEAVIRHNERPRGLSYEKICGYLDSWFDLLRQYDEFEGNKMLWYYDELMKIADRASENIYPDPQSKGDPNFHKNKLTEDMLWDLKFYMKEKHAYLYNKYL